MPPPGSAGEAARHLHPPTMGEACTSLPPAGSSADILVDGFDVGNVNFLHSVGADAMVRRLGYGAGPGTRLRAAAAAASGGQPGQGEPAIPAPLNRCPLPPCCWSARAGHVWRVHAGQGAEREPGAAQVGEGGVPLQAWASAPLAPQPCRDAPASLISLVTRPSLLRVPAAGAWPARRCSRTSMWAWATTPSRAAAPRPAAPTRRRGGPRGREGGGRGGGGEGGAWSGSSACLPGRSAHLVLRAGWSAQPCPLRLHRRPPPSQAFTTFWNIRAAGGAAVPPPGSNTAKQGDCSFGPGAWLGPRTTWSWSGGRFGRQRSPSRCCTAAKQPGPTFQLTTRRRPSPLPSHRRPHLCGRAHVRQDLCQLVQRGRRARGARKPVRRAAGAPRQPARARAGAPPVGSARVRLAAAGVPIRSPMRFN